jgi:hypothetical protein
MNSSFDKIEKYIIFKGVEDEINQDEEIVE